MTRDALLAQVEKDAEALAALPPSERRLLDLQWAALQRYLAEQAAIVEAGRWSSQ
jgi:hypothetical protein